MPMTHTSCGYWQFCPLACLLEVHGDTLSLSFIVSIVCAFLILHLVFLCAFSVRHWEDITAAALFLESLSRVLS